MVIIFIYNNIKIYPICVYNIIIQHFYYWIFDVSFPRYIIFFSFRELHNNSSSSIPIYICYILLYRTRARHEFWDVHVYIYVLKHWWGGVRWRNFFLFLLHVVCALSGKTCNQLKIKKYRFFYGPLFGPCYFCAIARDGGLRGGDGKTYFLEFERPPAEESPRMCVCV